MTNKRKRFQDSDSEEESAPGKQLLPVADLPDDFDDAPADGLQYLFLVRRDARRLPRVTRADNPYADAAKPLPTPNFAVSHPSLPSQEWRTAYENHFRNFRKHLAQRPMSTHPQKIMPEKSQRAEWWAFLAGRPESEWKQTMRAEESFSPRPPTPLLLRHIDQAYSLHLLMYFAYWINQHLDGNLPRISQVHAQWIFVLLALVDDHISADSMNMLRNLVRGNIALLKVLLQEPAESEGALTQSSCWIIITTVLGIWGQRDLWNDVETMLRSISSVI